MTVITTDLLLTGIRRDAAFAWLSKPDNHTGILSGAFADVSGSAGQYDITVHTSLRSRKMTYRFDRADDSHGGRRVLVTISGKRTRGTLHYSLRTMKPSTNTLVTIHMDYDPGSLLGLVANSTGLREALETGWAAVLKNMSRALVDAS